MKNKLPRKVRSTNALEDFSVLLEESLKDVTRNVIIVIIISITVWSLCSLLSHLVNYIASATYLNADVNEEALEDSNNIGALGILFGLIFTGALIRTVCLRFSSWQDSIGDGIANAIEHFHSSYEDVEQSSLNHIKRYHSPTFFSAMRRFFMTLTTIGTGGSGGLEGPTVAIGEAISSGWAKRFRVLNSYDLRIFQMAGIAAALSTLFTAPLTASIFAAEIVFCDKLIYRSFFYSLIAGVIAYYLNTHITGYQSALQSVYIIPNNYNYVNYLEAAFVGIFVAAPVTFLVNLIFRKLQSLLSLLPSLSRELTGALGLFLIVATSYLFFDIKPEYILGTGEHTIVKMLQLSGDSLFNSVGVILIILIAKTLATGFTLASGGSAGLVIPSMMIGGLAGAAVYHMADLVGLPLAQEAYHMFVIIGIATALVTIIEVPLAAIALVVESFNSYFGPPIIIACVLSHLLADKLSFYAIYAQMMSKIKKRRK